MYENSIRFNGFSGLYHNVRPKYPLVANSILLRYLNREPDLAVDLGCGTGLSSVAVAQIAKSVIGIDPNTDMLSCAKSAFSDVGNISFRRGSAEKIDLPDASADIVICSQALHWMRPEAAIPEISRVLKGSGVFAAVDYDWPAVYNLPSELSYQRLIDKVEAILAEHPEVLERSHKWPKSEHLQNVKKYGSFCYVREIPFHSEEPCDGVRFFNMAMSQSGVQAVLKSVYGRELDAEILKLKEAAATAYAMDNRTIYIPYKMMIGVAPET